MVMPVYNEDAIISSVVNGWIDVFKDLGSEVDWHIILVDDGSKDSTRSILESIRNAISDDKSLHEDLIIIHQKNKGHGQACRTGYIKALDLGSDWIFQTDSDGQTDPNDFKKLWNEKKSAPAVLGWRKDRKDGLFRKFSTRVLRHEISRFSHAKILDSNVPFRLVNRECLENALTLVPEDAEFQNILMTMAIVLQGNEIIWETISFGSRTTGKNSVTFWNMAKKGLKAISEMRTLTKIYGKCRQSI